MTAASPVVLAVDDDEDVLETYRIWLYDDCTVRTATDGEEGLEMVDRDVDVVLLDRMMSGMSGGQVLEEIRDREVDPQVIVVSAVDPDFTVIDMEFDAYLTKPLDQEGLVEAIENATRRADQPAEVQAFLRNLATKQILETTKDKSTLEASDRYADLVRRIEAERETAADALDGDPAEFV